MHKLQMYESLRDMLEREVKDIEKKGDLTEQSLDHLYKLMTALKVTDRCIDREKGEENGSGSNSNAMPGRYSNTNNSYAGMSNAGTSYTWPTGYVMDRMEMDRMSPNEKIRKGLEAEGIYSNDSYERGMSNARRGRDGDNDGRYNESRDNFRDNQSRDSYGYTEGYSRDASRKKMVQKLETLMDDTMSEHERQAIKDCIAKIK